MPSQEQDKRPGILVVDDTEANLDILVDALGDLYEVAVAMDGEAALEAVEDEAPDLILLDIMMPGMDGYEVCRRLKESPAWKDIPIIFLSALTEAQNKTKGFEMGAVDYITKPFEISEVLARCDTHLRLRAATATLEVQNRKLKEYARLRDEVERITRHDLKTPLNAVLGIPSMMIEAGGLTDEQCDMLKMLEESGYRMLDIVNSSLDLFKMELGKYQPEIVPVDVVKIVRQIRGETRQLMQGKGLGMTVRLNGRPAEQTDKLPVPGEESLLYSMLANLLKNAAEASPEGGEIGVDLDVGQFTILRIHNQGAVPEDIRNRFFEKFATSGKKDGTGLGTYSAGLIAKTLGGAIAMKTSREQGTTITIELPPPVGADAGEAEPPTTAPTPDASAKPSKLDRKMPILVVDDYSNMRRLVKSILRSMGFQELREAEDGIQALKILSSEKVGLVISDVNMPNMDGLSLLRNIRSSEAINDIPFLIVSGEAGQELILQAAKYKVSDYILKPFTPDVLRKKLEGIFDGTA